MLLPRQIISGIIRIRNITALILERAFSNSNILYFAKNTPTKPELNMSRNPIEPKAYVT